MSGFLASLALLPNRRDSAPSKTASETVEADIPTLDQLTERFEQQVDAGANLPSPSTPRIPSAPEEETVPSFDSIEERFNALAGNS